MILLGSHLNRIARILSILIIIFVAIGLQPWQCTAQEDLKSLVKSFNSLSQEEQQNAAMKIFKNYKEYQALNPWELDRGAAKAIDDEMMKMVHSTWSEVAVKKGGINYIVPVGSVGDRNSANYLPGKSDKDLIPQGTRASEAVDDFNKAFQKKYGLDPHSLKINVLDPTRVDTWPERVLAAANEEKFNTVGGNKWLQKDLWDKNPDVWRIQPLSGEIDPITYRGMTSSLPKLDPEDAAGAFSDFTRFRNELNSETNLEQRILKQSKYDLRNKQVYEVAKGELTASEKDLMNAAKLAREGKPLAAAEWYGQSLELTGTPALERYIKDMDALTEKMGKKCLAPLLEKASSSAGGAAKMELAGVLANLPEEMAAKLQKELIPPTSILEMETWDNARKTATWLRSSAGAEKGRSIMYDELNTLAQRKYGVDYNSLKAAEKRALSEAIEESTSFTSKLLTLSGKGILATAIGGLVAYDIYNAYKQGKEAGGTGYMQAFGRAVVTGVEFGCPLVGMCDLIARTVAMGTEWAMSAYKDEQLDSLFEQVKKDPTHMKDVLDLADYTTPSALRDMAMQIRELAKKNGKELTQDEVDRRVREELEGYINRRLNAEKAWEEYEKLADKTEDWIKQWDIPLMPGGDFITAKSDNEWLFRNDPTNYLLLKENLMQKFLDLKAKFKEDKIATGPDDSWIWSILYQLYRGTPEGFDKAMNDAYEASGKFYGLARVVKTSGGDPLINHGNLSGRDPLGFLNCLCNLNSIMGVNHQYDPNPAGDCVYGNWGVNREPLPTVSDFKNNSCAISYGITQMRTNKTPIQFVGAGTILKNGDQLIARGKTLLAMPDGSELLINPNSVVNFTSTGPGKVLVKVQQGGARVLSAPGGSSNVEVQLGDKLIRPKGTEYIVQWDGNAGSVAVVEGYVTLTNETAQANETIMQINETKLTYSNATETEISLAAGQQLETSTGKISPYNLSTDDGGLFVGLPLRELLLNASDPEPYGTYDGAFADGKISEGWIWQDPGKDTSVETPEPGTLKVTVPDGNELWGYPGYSMGQRTDAPRLLHKVTGDFDLEGELLLKSNGTDYAVTQFVLYSPGSNLGILANQMKTDGLGEDYWVGGGWQKQWGINKLTTLNKELKDCPDAPDKPVMLKMTRRGNVWKNYWSLDGRQWNLSTRAEFNASETVWVGLVFKRIANDGLRSEPAINTLKEVSLVTEPLGSMETPQWDLAPCLGKALADNKSIRLELNGSVLGNLGVYSGKRFYGDFDVIVHFNTSNWTGLEGERRELSLFATKSDDKNMVYIGISQSGTEHLRYQTDLGINGGWNRYDWKETTDLQGYLRIVRSDGNFSSYYWNECQWVLLREFKAGFGDPAYIGVGIGNVYQAKKPVPLVVDFEVEQIQKGEEDEMDWKPAYCSLIQPAPLPLGITLPQSVEAKMFKPAFALGTIFFGPDGTAYAFSSEMGKQKLIAIDDIGTANTYAESEILAGVNRKTGVILGPNILMTVDGWYEGGNRYSGIFELSPNGTFRQWNLKSSYGGLGDIVSAPDGGWYFSDFESDNIWHLPAEGVAEEPSITIGDRSSRIGLIQLAYDGADGTLYTLDNYLDFRNAGTFRVCKITQDGEVVEVAKINETSKMNGGMALSSNGPFGHALYVSDAASGNVFKVNTDGTTKPVITALIKPGEIQFNPVTGDLLIVCDDGKSLLWIGSDLGRIGTGGSVGVEGLASFKVKPTPPLPIAGPRVDLSGDWIMQGKQTGVENSDWKAVLTLKADGALSWLQTEGANIGTTRKGTWEFDGTTLTMKWSSPKGGQLTWTSNSVSSDGISQGTYTAELVSGGTWSALRSGTKVYESEPNRLLQSSSLFGNWKMEGQQTGVENSDWKATLTLNSDGTLKWIQTEGANVGANRSGTWGFDGKTLTLKWSSSKGGHITWISSSASEDMISEGTYTAELVPGGTWSASR